jgi:hypothetical protein
MYSFFVVSFLAAGTAKPFCTVNKQTDDWNFIQTTFSHLPPALITSDLI